MPGRPRRKKRREREEEGKEVESTAIGRILAAWQPVRGFAMLLGWMEFVFGGGTLPVIASAADREKAVRKYGKRGAGERNTERVKETRAEFVANPEFGECATLMTTVEADPFSLSRNTPSRNMCVYSLLRVRINWNGDPPF